MPTIYQYHPPYQWSLYQDALHESQPCYNGYIEDPLDPVQQHARDLERIQNFRLIDDDFMSAVFEDIPSAELLLQVILGRDDLMAQSVKCQNWIQNLQGRSVRLDILAHDLTGKTYNVEVQRADAGAGALRARYHSSILDANITELGERYENLNETHVIFITENDVIGKGLPIYHINRTIKETGDEFGDRSHIVYVNSQIRDDATALGRLMHDFWCTSHKDMHYQVLADRVRYFKTDEEGIQNMCKAIEDMRNEVAEAATKRTKTEIARSLLALHRMTPEEIADSTQLTLQEVRALDTRQPA